ncbi:hypothetical protein QFZ48_004563 [Chitinophaga sp. W2I13]|uniref:hypothetical protein n=1 Tax=Chitinophaga sp. W2I13 TaxID=3373923 RepID=UPI003D1E41E2
MSNFSCLNYELLPDFSTFQWPDLLGGGQRSKDPKKIEKALSSFISFKEEYQTWYSEACALIKIVLPDRLSDFIKLYEKPKTRKAIEYGNYVIEDYLISLTVRRGGEFKVGPEAAIPQFEQQVSILKSVERRFESSLFDIRQLVQADLFDSELEAAKELAKNKFHRAAGAIGGVVLEKHLAQVCSNHNLNTAKKNPTINDFNELLKANNVIDIPRWRFIQHLADIRNVCDHNKREPTEDEVIDLLKGVDKLTKTLF